MKLTRYAFFAAILSAAAVYATPTNTLTYNLSASNQDLGSSYSFTPNGSPTPAIMATGFTVNQYNGNISLVDLYGKNDGNDEVGLGLVNDPSGDHEVTVGSGIMLNMSNLSGDVNQAKITVGSDTGNEGWILYGSNYNIFTNYVGFAKNYAEVSGNTEGLANVSSLDGYKYLYFTASCGNVLLSTLTVTTPEPASFALVGGMGAALLLLRRRAAKKA